MAFEGRQRRYGFRALNPVVMNKAGCLFEPWKMKPSKSKRRRMWITTDFELLDNVLVVIESSENLRKYGDNNRGAGPILRRL